MSISLEQLTQILSKARISSSQEEEILIASKDVITPPEANKEESKFEEFCIADEEHLFELEVEEDEEGISGDHHAIRSYIGTMDPSKYQFKSVLFLLLFDQLTFSTLSFAYFYTSQISFCKIRFEFLFSFVRQMVTLKISFYVNNL